MTRGESIRSWSGHHGRRLAAALALVGTLAGASEASLHPGGALRRPWGERDADPSVTHLGRPDPLHQALRGWDALRRRWQEEHGISIETLYTMMFQHGTQGGPDNQTLNQGVDIYAAWANLVDHPWLGQGSLDVYLQHRKDDILGTGTAAFSEALAVVMEVNDAESAHFDGTFNSVSQLAWKQVLFARRMTIAAGQVDPDSNFDENRFAGDDRLSFFAKPLANDPVSAVCDPGLGGLVWIEPREWVHVGGGVIDGSASGEYPDFESLGDGRWAYLAEAALTPTFESLGRGNYRFSFQRLDARGTLPASEAFSLSFDQEIGSRVGIFLRYATGDGERTGVEQSLGTGVVRRGVLRFVEDWVGAGFFWGRPTPRLRDELGVELYWRLQVTERLLVTPDVQLWRPSRDRGPDVRAVFGVRLGIVF